MKGSFRIIAEKENIITEKGVRAFIMERLLNRAFNKGAVFNIDNKTVEVQLEGDEEQIKSFIEDLKKSLSKQFGNPVITLTAFQKNDALEMPELMRSSQALMVGQLEKGITIQLRILNALEELPNKLANALK
ncbi:MAG: hypothetical protein V1494_05885 [Candidatus Diapherotrites archaeon]